MPWLFEAAFVAFGFILGLYGCTIGISWFVNTLRNRLDMVALLHLDMVALLHSADRHRLPITKAAHRPGGTNYPGNGEWGMGQQELYDN